jgi:hypothetical protein
LVPDGLDAHIRSTVHLAAVAFEAEVSFLVAG